MSTKFYNNNGAVSVFLVMILVPVLVVVSLFVDISRVKLGEGLVASAEDIALNTLLTQYDADLKEHYGLIGSCQDISDYYDSVTSSFENSLKSQDTDTSLDTFWADAGSMFAPSSPATNDIVDLLQISEDTAGVSVKAVNGANLANPTLMKTQIVEFMKYRTPINLVTGLLGKVLNNMKGSSDDLQDAKTDNEIVELKQDFLTSENDLLGKLKKAYDYIVEYENKNLTKEHCIQVKEYLNGVEGQYKNFHTKMVKDLYNTEGLTQFTHVTYNLNTYKNKTYSEYEDKTNPTHISNLVRDSIFLYGDWSTQFYNKKAELEAAMKEITPNDIGEGNEQGYDIQYWESLYNKIKTLYDEFKISAQKMYDSYGKMIYINSLYGVAPYSSEVISLRSEKDKYFYDYVVADYKARKDKGPKKYSKLYELALKHMEQTHNKYFSSTLTADTNDTYITIILKLEQISKDNINEIKSDTINNEIKSLHDYLVGSDNKTGQKGYLEDARNKLNSAKAILNPTTLSAYIESYQKKYKAYKDKVEASDTEFSKEEKARIDELKDVVENVTLDSVTVLSDRLANVDAEISLITKYIDELKYQSTQVININKYSLLKTAAKSVVKSENIPIKNSELSSYVDSTFSFSKRFNSDLALNFGDTNHPELKNVNEPVLLKWMREKFKPDATAEKPKDYDKEKAEKEFDGKDSSKQKEADSKESDEAKEDATKDSAIGNIISQYKDVKTEFPSGLSGANGVNFGDILVNFPVLAYNLATNWNTEINNLRDSLYTTDYVMNMFTHDTFEKERLIDAAVAKDENKYATLTFAGVDTIISGEKSNWTNEDYEYTYNKTLTNKMFSKDNNFAYGAEIEYILKGGKNSANIACVYGNIYALRLVANTPICFKEFWRNGELNAFAAGIQALTYGVVPQALTKTLMILITICAESGYDLIILKKGLEVPVVKTKESQLTVVSAVVPAPGEYKCVKYTKKGKKYVPDTFGMSYEDYLMVFLLLGLNDGSDVEVGAIYKRIGDVIQANMRKVTGDNGKNYKLSNTVELFEIEANMQVDPLFLDLPFMSEYSNRPTTSSPSGWCKFKYKTVRGY